VQGVDEVGVVRDREPELGAGRILLLHLVKEPETIHSGLDAGLAIEKRNVEVSAELGPRLESRVADEHVEGFVGTERLVAFSDVFVGALDEPGESGNLLDADPGAPVVFLADERPAELVRSSSDHHALAVTVLVGDVGQEGRLLQQHLLGDGRFPRIGLHLGEKMLALTLFLDTIQMLIERHTFNSLHFFLLRIC